MACNGYDEFGRRCVHKNDTFGFEYTCKICAPESLRRRSEETNVGPVVGSKKKHRQSKIRDRRARRYATRPSYAPNEETRQ